MLVICHLWLLLVVARKINITLREAQDAANQVYLDVYGDDDRSDLEPTQRDSGHGKDEESAVSDEGDDSFADEGEEDERRGTEKEYGVARFFTDVGEVFEDTGNPLFPFFLDHFHFPHQYRGALKNFIKNAKVSMSEAQKDAFDEWLQSKAGKKMTKLVRKLVTSPVQEVWNWIELNEHTYHHFAKLLWWMGDVSQEDLHAFLEQHKRRNFADRLCYHYQKYELDRDKLRHARELQRDIWTIELSSVFPTAITVADLVEQTRWMAIPKRDTMVQLDLHNLRPPICWQVMRVYGHRIHDFRMQALWDPEDSPAPAPHVIISYLRERIQTLGRLNPAFVINLYRIYGQFMRGLPYDQLSLQLEMKECRFAERTVLAQAFLLHAPAASSCAVQRVRAMLNRNVRETANLIDEQRYASKSEHDILMEWTVRIMDASRIKPSPAQWELIKRLLREALNVPIEARDKYAHIINAIISEARRAAPPKQ